MSTIIKKFGGSSVANIEKIKAIASIIKKDLANNPRVIVVVSAMEGETNRMDELCRQVSSLITPENLQSYDGAVTSGEQFSSNLMALALQEQGIRSRAFQGWQVPILTDDNYAKASIREVYKHNLEEFLNSGGVPVVSGFQGITEHGEITSLGRGGSDTTAMALAASFGASACEIFTDVEGIYSADPSVVETASKIDKITHEEMLEFSKLGAKVLHPRAAFLSMKYNIATTIMHAFADEEQDESSQGTEIVRQKQHLEQNYITGITCNSDIAMINIYLVAGNPANIKIFEALAHENINIDLIMKTSNANTFLANYSDNDPHAKFNLSLTVPRSELALTKLTLNSLARQNVFSDFDYEDNISLVSLIGAGMNSHSGIALRLFKALEKNAIQAGAVSTSEIKISIIIPAECARKATKILHEEFGLS
jgi:aspartate kinase